MEPICLHIQGNLGNQLFQVATLLAFALERKRPLCIYKDFDLDFCNSWLFAFKRCFQDRQCFDTLRQKKYYQEPCLAYRPIPAESTVMHGFFQSPKYFDNIKPLLQTVFTLPLSMQSFFMNKYSNLIQERLRQTGIVVHIRRGDYLNNPKTHGILDQDYFESAIERARHLSEADAPLIVFSDDPSWCRHQAFLAKEHIVEDSTGYASLFLMTLFRRFIISNSTFSWWGAYLARDVDFVIAPDKWFGPEGPQDFDDIYCPEWIRFPVILK